MSIPPILTVRAMRFISARIRYRAVLTRLKKISCLILSVFVLELLCPRYFCYTIFMASYISHYLAAKAVIEKSPADSVIRKYADCFILGAQGGDMLFYAFGQFKGYGARTHREKTAQLFAAALNYCREENRPEPLAYTLGLLTHYALDSAIHPYVVYEAKERLTAVYPPHLYKCLHMMLETRIDCEMKKLAAENTCSLKSMLPSTKRAAKSLADVWTGAVNKVFGTEVPYKLLLKLPSRMYRYQRVFLKPHSLPCAVLRFAAKKLGYPAYITGFFLPDKNEPSYDFLNLEKRSYPEYVGAENTVNFSYPEIFENSVKSSLSLHEYFLRLLKNGEAPDPSTFSLSFSGSPAV